VNKCKLTKLSRSRSFVLPRFRYISLFGILALWVSLSVFHCLLRSFFFPSLALSPSPTHFHTISRARTRVRTLAPFPHLSLYRHTEEEKGSAMHKNFPTMLWEESEKSRAPCSMSTQGSGSLTRNAHTDAHTFRSYIFVLRCWTGTFGRGEIKRL